jgi:prophage DNA circulation protein
LARSWLWQIASFDGATFYVKDQEVKQSRRIIRHEYPGSESHDLEDLGRNTTCIELCAYFLSETADTDLAAFMARLVQPDSPGLLIVPMFDSIVCRAEKWAPRWEKEALNYASCQVTFLEEGTAGAPIPSGLASAQLAVMADVLGSALGDAISGVVAAAPLNSYLRSDITTYVTLFGALAQTAVSSVPIAGTVTDAAMTAISDAVNSLSGAVPVGPGAVFSAIVAQVNAVTETQIGNDSAGATGAASVALSAAMQAALAIYEEGLTAWDEAPGSTIVPLAAAMAFAAAASVLISTAVYPDRQAAIDGRTQISTLCSQVQAIYSATGAAAMDAFDGMCGAAANFLSRAIINLAPYVIVEVGASLPSNVLAWRLYADPSRAGELDRLNRVATPCFMPTKFIALSS